MSLKAQVTCHCGQRILQRDVLQKGQFTRLFTPGFVYVKFRCSRCKRVSERFVPQEQWDDGAMRDVPLEATREERRHFAALGPIGVDEVIDFHFSLDEMPLEDLLEQLD